MNRSKLKTYAIQARRDFIRAVTERAASYGLTRGKAEPVLEQGDVAIIAGKPFPRSVAGKRRRLEERIERHGFEQAMEAMAYTWFNRLVAIRFMELHGYLDHGYRVLSHPDPNSTTPEILEHAEHVTLPGLKAEEIIELKLDGNKEAELYRKLLIAQCNALSAAMPFLFERIDDETELLLPDNLLHSDSILRKLVAETDEEDWQEVEIIGWLYQFYISEKKDQVIGKVVKSEDIPAATQLFTPNWIVKYLVQNSLGRQWVATYPDSSLKAKMEYYIEPAEQTPEVQAELDEITPESLSPEELTLLDPACGSGHILVEAYDLLKEIYLERGYRLREIPGLILTKNLFGLEIDDRAGQLAAFALMMKARADDRRIFDGKHQPNVISIQESNGLDINAIVQAFTSKQVSDESFTPPGEFGFMAPIKTPLLTGQSNSAPAGDDQIAADLKSLLHLFENAKTYGSLIAIPESLAERLPAIAAAVEKAMASKDWTIRQAGRVASVFVSQASILVGKYDAVVANPPYMGRKAMNQCLKDYARLHYSRTRVDLFAMFVERIQNFLPLGGRMGVMTPFVWMFLGSYLAMRRLIMDDSDIESLVRPEYHAFFESAYVPICAYITHRRVAGDEVNGCNGIGTYVDLADFYGVDRQPEKFLEAIRSPHVSWRYAASAADFQRIPGWPIAYWLPKVAVDLFGAATTLGQVADCRQGLATGNNDRFLRYWHEPSIDRIGFGYRSNEEASESSKRWFPCQKGGPSRKWYGNHEFVVDWEHDGKRLRKYQGSVIRNAGYYFREGGTWSSLTVSALCMRMNPEGFVFESKGPVAFPKKADDLPFVLAFCNSTVIDSFLRVLAPTMDFSQGPLGSVPFIRPAGGRIPEITAEAICLAETDWDAIETSWSFTRHPVVPTDMDEDQLVSSSYGRWKRDCESRMQRLRELEEENNRMWIDLYGLQEHVESAVREEDVTLVVPSESGACAGLLSYAVGVAMGRYSLDEPGLIYAHSGNEGFDPRRYKTLPADKDGIVPLTEIDWFEDDAARRFEEFIAVAWPKEHLEENLAFVAESLGAKKGEQPRDTIRRYFAKSFFKDHLKTYKKRPIYWLFSSGKLGAFQCLVYLHRYNEGTLARMRTEYVIPLQGKIASRLEQIGGRDGEGGDIASATSAAHKSRLRKEHELLRRHQVELASFDEKLRHYADQRIKLDLDDGVKVNYGKFGDLLAEVRAVCGRKKDED